MKDFIVEINAIDEIKAKDEKDAKKKVRKKLKVFSGCDFIIYPRIKQKKVRPEDLRYIG